MEASRHLRTVSHQLQQRYLTLKRAILAGDVFLIAVGVAFLATLGMTLFGWPVSPLVLYGSLSVLALLVWLILAWRVRIGPLPVLITADDKLGLQERLSTAYEYVEQQPHNPFVPSLAAEAEQAARRVEPHQVFPFRMPQRLWCIPLILIALVVLSQVDMAPFQFEDWGRADVSDEVLTEGKRLERWGRRLEALAQQEKLDRSLILARHIQDLGRRLQREDDKGGEASERINTLSQYLQRMQQELRERSLMSATGDMTVQEMLTSGKSVKQELQDILNLLREDALPKEMRQVAEQGVQRLSQVMQGNAELSELMQNLQAGNVAAARQLVQDLLRKQQAAEEMEHLDRARRALQYSSRAIQRGGQEDTQNKNSSSNQQPQRADAGDGGDFDDETMSEDMPGMEDFASPGFSGDFGFSGHGKKGNQQRLRESEQPVSQVRVKSGEGKMRLSYVRHLPLQNEAKVPLEQAVAPYQRAAEEVLTQEQIPRGYREQIKQYFLAIGMAQPEAQ
ncbi:MAG: hypothetical protein ETSY1_12760 [Candidatus Entotheonella factor]|uniref:DUF4175 domain-containing protein n=1 Tax=Entotheonella factor TaxID=1429438 RepID=W4LQ84_ENTF1|nr:MAG: hypothetical protein ETSY1_12760 [Candidatus Entotheonella factor]